MLTFHDCVLVSPNERGMWGVRECEICEERGALLFRGRGIH